MKHKRIFSIILLSIFILTQILTLQNALADCEKGREYYESLIKTRQAFLEKAEADLEKVENKSYLESMRESMIIAASIGLGSGIVIGLCFAPSVAVTSFTGVIGGGISGSVLGFISHYRALRAAREAVTNAKTALKEARQKLQECKAAEAENAISPKESQISIRYSPTHTADIFTTQKIASIHMRLDPVSPDTPIPGFESSYKNWNRDEVYGQSISYTFKSGDYKGTYNVSISVAVWKENGTLRFIYRTYPINVGD